MAPFPVEASEITLLEVIENLNDAEILRDDTYQQLKTDLERGHSSSRANILWRMADDARQQWLADNGYPTNTLLPIQTIDIEISRDVEISSDVDSFNSEDLEHLRLFLEELNTTENIDIGDLGQFGTLLEALSAIEGEPSPEDLRELQNLLEQWANEQNARAIALKARLPQVLEQLVATGLITERVYHKLKPEIGPGAINTDFHLYQQAESWMRLNDELSVVKY